MKVLMLFAAFSGMLAVMLGAFAAHGLKNRLSDALLSAFETGVHYQMMHSLALLLIVILYRQAPQALLLYSGYAMAVGILLFSGSLYALALSGLKWFGPVTPIGGVCFIVGWALLAASVLKSAETLS